MLFVIIVSKPCTPRQGKTKVEVAKMIQATKDNVVIKYNKLHADPKQGDTHCTLKKKTMKRTNVKHFMGTGLISR